MKTYRVVTTKYTEVFRLERKTLFFWSHIGHFSTDNKLPTVPEIKEKAVQELESRRRVGKVVCHIEF